MVMLVPTMMSECISVMVREVASGYDDNQPAVCSSDSEIWRDISSPVASPVDKRGWSCGSVVGCVAAWLVVWQCGWLCGSVVGRA